MAPQLVISDIKMEKVGGFDVLRERRELIPATAVIMITGFASVETAVEAMKLGAYDYVTKPFKIDELQLTIQRALDFQSAVRENVYLKKELKERYRFENIIGTSDKMQEIYNLIAKIADTDSTILIQGESGTGKELVARALHFNSSRAASALRGDQLQRAAGESAGVGTLRPQERGLHRRSAGQDGALRGSAAGDHFSG